ncbi:hypothetical protein LXL04_001821 [Taraxacum kok-saghyz]
MRQITRFCQNLPDLSSVNSPGNEIRGRVTEEHGGDGWKEVASRKRESARKASDSMRDICLIAITFYVCNLPERWKSRDLWKAFDRLGVLVDAFVPGRRDRMGACYGFVRFIKVSNVQVMLEKMNELVFEGRNLKANVSLHPRGKKQGEAPTRTEERPPKHTEKPWIAGAAQRVWDGKMHGCMGGYSTRGPSYADMLNAENRVMEKGNPVSVTIPDELVVQGKKWLQCSLIGEMLDLERLSKCLSMVHAYGLGDCDIKYLGGLSVMLIFNSPEVANCFLHNQKINWSIWFAWLKAWDATLQPHSRAVWLRIRGVPVSLWDSEVFSSIASAFGKVLIPFNCKDEAENLSFGKVCVLTESMELIKTQDVNVAFKGSSFKVEDSDSEFGVNDEDVQAVMADAVGDNGDLDAAGGRKADAVGYTAGGRKADAVGDNDEEEQAVMAGSGSDPWTSHQANDGVVGVDSVSCSKEKTAIDLVSSKKDKNDGLI